MEEPGKNKPGIIYHNTDIISRIFIFFFLMLNSIMLLTTGVGRGESKPALLCSNFIRDINAQYFIFFTPTGNAGE